MSEECPYSPESVNWWDRRTASFRVVVRSSLIVTCNNKQSLPVPHLIRNPHWSQCTMWTSVISISGFKEFNFFQKKCQCFFTWKIMQVCQTLFYWNDKAKIMPDWVFRAISSMKLPYPLLLMWSRYCLTDLTGQYPMPYWFNRSTDLTGQYSMFYWFNRAIFNALLI